MIEERLDGFSPDDFKDDDIPFDLNPSDERSEPPPFEELVEAEGERIRAHQEEFAELAVYLERRGITLDDFAIAYEIAHQRKKKDAGPHEIDLVLLEHERTADIPARVWFIDGMITTGFNLVIAKKSIGKSFLVLDMAIAISGGFDFLDDAQRKPGCSTFLRNWTGSRYMNGSSNMIHYLRLFSFIIPGPTASRL